MLLADKIMDGLVLKSEKGSRFCLKHFKFRIKPKNPLWDRWVYCTKCYKEAGKPYGE